MIAAYRLTDGQAGTEAPALLTRVAVVQTKLRSNLSMKVTRFLLLFS